MIYLLNLVKNYKEARMISIEHFIRQDFESRLRRAQEYFDRLRDTIVIKKLIELHNICSTDVYALFHKIQNCGFEHSLENFENLLSIVGNFYDDSFYGVVWEVPDTITKMRTYNKQKVDELKRPYIIQVFDHDNLPHLNELQFCDIIQYYIDRGLLLNKKLDQLNKGK
jgi:hypothetical protein